MTKVLARLHWKAETRPTSCGDGIVLFALDNALEGWRKRYGMSLKRTGQLYKHGTEKGETGATL